MAVLGGEKGRGFSQDHLLLHAQDPVLPAELDQLLPLAGGQAFLVALANVSASEPVAQTALADADVGDDLGLARSRASSTARRRNSGG